MFKTLVDYLATRVRVIRPEDVPETPVQKPPPPPAPPAHPRTIREIVRESERVARWHPSLRSALSDDEEF